MEEQRFLPKRAWDTARELPNIEDERTPWKMIKLLKFFTQCLVALVVFGSALCSKTSFLLLVTLSNEGTKILLDEQIPVALLCIGCSIVTPSVFLLLKSLWKICFESSKLPSKKTAALVLSFEFIVSSGAAILTIVAMPHLDIVTNVTILNGVAILSSLLQIVSQCYANERNRFLVPSILAFILTLLGYVLFVVLYIGKDPTNVRMAIWVGLAVGGALLVSLNWWQIYLRELSASRSSVFLKELHKDTKRSQNFLHIISSLLRIAVTACVLGAYVPLAQMDWDIVRSIPGRETTIIAIIIGVQLVSSVLCYWFSLVACKMHALRRCFLVPLYLASLAVMVLFIVPVIVYYEDYKLGLNDTASANFTGYCATVVDGRNRTLTGNIFPELVLDVTHTLCYLDMSAMIDIGLLTGSAVSWWLGLVLSTAHLWQLGLYRIQRTQDLFIRSFYEGGLLEQSMMLNTRFNIQKRNKDTQSRTLDPVKVYLCATMWHETCDEMKKMIVSIFRLDMFRPKLKGKESDATFEAHIYFDDAFKTVPGSRERHVNEYAETLVETLADVYGIFLNLEKGLFLKQQQIPDQKVVRTPYGGRLECTMPYGNVLTVHFKDKQLIRHKKRWSQVMYLYYLLGWKVASKYYKDWSESDEKSRPDLSKEYEKEKHNTYVLALDGDTDFQPSAVMLLIDRLKLYPRVGAACGRIHPTGSGPLVWYQKFEYAVGHWLHKTAEHVIGCVLCSPGCFSLFRASALMDDNVMKKYTAIASKAQHHIQYDQGEDRWLCTLLLKQGWRVEYNAASDAYTNAPEEFKEFYNQRRRWGPSTMANIADLLGYSTSITMKNKSMSKPYMFYQFFVLASSILSPSTVVLMIAGCLTLLLDVSANAGLVMAVIPPIVFLGVSYKIKADTQIMIAAVMSVLYAFIMLIAAVVIIGEMVREQTIFTPSSLFLICLAAFYLLTALLHPQETQVVIYGLLYIVCIPSAYLLLAIYSMINMNNVSWGTRETAPPPGAAQAAQAPPRSNMDKARSALSEVFCETKCCEKPCRRGSMSEPIVVEEEEEPQEVQPQETIVDDVQSVEPEQWPQEPQECQEPQEPVYDAPHQSWVSQLQSVSDDMNLQEDHLQQVEEQFFTQLISKYLEPLTMNKEEQEEMAKHLKSLRNKISFLYFIFNAFWLMTTFILQLISSISILVPKLDSNLQPTGQFISIEPLGFMFIFSFALLVVIQFVTMLIHRVNTLIHLVAYLDTEPIDLKHSPQITEGLRDDDDEEDEDDYDEEDLAEAVVGDTDHRAFPDLLHRRGTDGVLSSGRTF